ncbi:calponin homology domain-containing protein [Syncephalastrum racemosum]|uniref:Calponin homology domain-containing protein n=1 Tax=Syncephalastrum racemosum TaxID=13706 RepID=A0A1X2HES5_SYNRA|nr:calponin homology domain-containing protein [Syncephalastrum racemosum]
MDTTWLTIQQKTFTKWVNNKLDIGHVPNIKDLKTDLSNGVRLIQLLEIIGSASLGRYSTNPRMRIQCVENVNMALEFVKQRGVPLTNIGAEDIVDKNLKLVLGMLWMIISRFAIGDINQDGKNPKEGLLLWCQRKTAPYKQVNVVDFTSSWQDGLAFCALIHRHRPDLLDFDSLDFNNRHQNTALAFEVAERHLGIPKLLDVEDVCDISKPDERSIMTYVAEYFHAFSSLDKVETAGRRVAKFADVLNSIWQMQNDYEERATALISAVEGVQRAWKMADLTDSYMETKQKGKEFATYKSTTKREWVSEKRDLGTLLGNIQTKLKTYNLKPYYPPEHLTLQNLDNVWYDLLQDEATYHRRINSKIRDIKENLRKAYAKAANDLQRQLDATSTELSSLDGDLDHQLNRVRDLLKKVKPFQSMLKQVENLDRDCLDANTEENDYTVYSVEDLTFELGLVEQAIRKKSAFIQNQIVSRNMTNLTPAQLEEFEHAFRHFATEHNNTLSIEGFVAAMASLGMFFHEEEIEPVFAKVTGRREEATFEQFIRFMVSITEDKSTPEQLQDAFWTIAGEKPYVTELDLKMCMVPEPAIQYLKRDMPASADGYDYDHYVQQMFR